MRQPIGTFTGTAARVAAASAFAILAGSLSLAPARADEAQARTLLKSMTDYIAAQKAIAIDYDSNLEVVTNDDQKLALLSSGALTINRPDKIEMTRTGGFANVEAAFDGKTLTLLGKNSDAYSQVEVPGTIDQLITTLRDKYHKPVPGADLLMSDPYTRIMHNVTNVKDLGSGVIRGQECDHVAARAKDVDWQVWIARGDHPYPCRFVITSTKLKGSPQYTMDIRSWKAGDQVASTDFKVDVGNARKVTPTELANFDELPAIFALKKTTGESTDTK